MIQYHFKPLDQSAEVGVFLVVSNEGRLNSLSCTFNVHTRPIHLGEIHPLQVSQAPEQDLKVKGLKLVLPVLYIITNIFFKIT